jgi:hypothetical protein
MGLVQPFTTKGQGTWGQEAVKKSVFALQFCVEDGHRVVCRSYELLVSRTSGLLYARGFRV